MKWIYAVQARLRLLFRRTAEERMDEEIRFHIEMETEKNVRAGLPPAEARRRALLAFGGVEGHREAMRDGRTLAWLGGMRLDLKLGVRMMVKHRGLSLIGGFSMAVATAVGAIAFEAISEVLNPAIPVEEGGRVVSLQYATDNPGNPERRIVHDFAAWREELRSVEELGAFRTVEQNLAWGDAPPEAIKVAEMTATGFLVARTPPLLGRYLVPDDERGGAPPVVVIGEDAWRARFGGDPAIVGRAIQLGGVPRVVVGVMPAEFRFPVSHRFWIPLRIDPTAHERMRGPDIHVFGRLAPGAGMDEAQAELTTVGRRAAAAHPALYERLQPRVLPYPSEHLEVDHPLIRAGLRIVQLLVGGLLVIVAVNLAILLYARTVARLGEIAMRSALGASRRRILAQLFMEAFALSAVGAAAGLALAAVVLHWVRGKLAIVDDLPFWIELKISPGTVLYAFALAMLAAAIMGVLPGLKATGSRMNAGLRELGAGGGPRLGRVWSSLIVAQVAVAVAILPLAVFTVWQVVRMEVAEVGFPAEELAVGWLVMSEEAVAAAGGVEGSGLDSLFGARQAELMRRLAAEPGVSAVTFSSAVPGVDGVSRPLELDGPPGPETPRSDFVHVGLGMFDAYDARILAGRAFHAGDLGTRSVVVNQNFARRFLAEGGALGRRLRHAPRKTADGKPAEREEWYEIVGVVEDFPAVPLGIGSTADGVANVYRPAAPGDLYPARLTVRYEGGIPAGYIGRMREIGAEVDPELQLGMRPLAELYDSLRSGSRFAAWGLALITLSVLLLSAAGIYALMSFTVARRTREIGIRAALGAYPRRILADIFGRVARQLTVGVLVGSLLSGALFFAAGLGLAQSAALMASVAAIMLTVGLLAAFGPARRGLRIQPTEALREA